MLYLRLSAADITLSLLSRGPASQQSRNLAVNFREVVHSVLTFSLLNVFLDPELVHASKNNRILCLKTVPMIEVSHSFVVGESPSEILEYMPREVEAKKF